MAGSGSKPQYAVALTLRFLVLTVSGVALLGFGVGRASRALLLDGLVASHSSPVPSSPTRPVLADGKDPPRTTYSSKSYDTSEYAKRSSDVHIVNLESDPIGLDHGRGTETCADADGSCSRGGGGDIQNDVNASASASATVADDEEHLPAGQHLLVDIKNVDGEFLNSEIRLAEAMVNLAAGSELTLLSYHCHSLKPMGVSCVGVLLESHISFHTWPLEGVITLDLFTCGSKPLVPSMPLIEKEFAVPMRAARGGPKPDQPHFVWSHKLRGFRDESILRKDPLASDLGRFLLEVMDYDLKKELVSVQSDYQRIDIYEVIHPRFRDYLSYIKSLSQDGSYEANHPDLYQPDRIVFLDGVQQSSLYGDAPYHESLVHPGMFAHPDPKRVAIIGGGEGATLREVLKHRTVETCTMIEIDEVMVKTSREYLPSWSDCSAFGDADWCVDESRADVRYEDALAWFIDRFSEDGTKRADSPEPFDVIIMDALDPQDHVPFAEALYDNVDFLEAIYESMSDDGVIIMQLGESPSLVDAADSLGLDRKRSAITKLLRDVGFESMHAYEDGHSNFMYPWSYLVAFKSYSNRLQWYLNEAELEIAIHQRILPTKDGKSPLNFFDGATMKTFQVPNKAFETVFCREYPRPDECDWCAGFHPEAVDSPVSMFEVMPAGEKGFGIFAKEDISKGSMIAAEESTKAIKCPPTTYEMMGTIARDFPAAEALQVVPYYLHFYGFQSQVLGGPEYRVDSGILTFVNHGCNGTANMGDVGVSNAVTEATADPENMPPQQGKVDEDGSIHHIVIDRHINQVMLSDASMRDIKAGEEILNDYLAYSSEAGTWKEDVMEMKKWCEMKD